MGSPTPGLPPANGGWLRHSEYVLQALKSQNERQGKLEDKVDRNARILFMGVGILGVVQVLVVPIIISMMVSTWSGASSDISNSSRPSISASRVMPATPITVG